MVLRRLLGEPDGGGALAGDLAGQSHCPLHECRARHAGFDDAEAQQLGPGHAVAGQHHAAQRRMAEQALRMASRRRAGRRRSRAAERALLGRKEDVAGGGDGEPRPQRRAVQGADDRLGALADGVEALADATVVLPALPARGEPAAALHVGAGREHLAGTREDGHAHVLAVAQGVEDIGHLGIELGVLGIDRRVVHGDDGDAVSDRELDECDFHPCTSQRALRKADDSRVGGSCSLPSSSHMPQRRTNHALTR